MLAFVPALTFVLLFAPGAVADRHREHSQSQFLKQPTGVASDPVIYADYWAGAIWNNMNNGTFCNVTGKFTIPVPTGRNASASAWVGIDGGGTCPGGLLQTGVDFWVDDNEETSYHAWYEWFPDVSFYWDDFPISAHDVIKTTVVALNATFGIAMVENLTQNQSKVAQLNSTHILCGMSAEWIVEDFSDVNGNLLPFANFSTVTFSDALAAGPSGVFTPDGATILDMQQNNQILTSATVNGSSVTITYV